MGVGSRGSLLHSSTPGGQFGSVTPIWASADDLASIREDSREPFGHAKNVAAGLVEDAGDDAALGAAWPTGCS